MTKKMFVLQGIVFLLVCAALPFLLLIGCSPQKAYQVEDRATANSSFGAGKLPDGY